MATKHRGPGRPRVPHKKALGRVFGARFRADEERQIAGAIERSGRTPSDWIREALLAAARRG